MAMTYRLHRQQSDSRRFFAYSGRDLVASREAGLARSIGRRLIWGQVRLVRWKFRPGYPEPANPLLLGV